MIETMFLSTGDCSIGPLHVGVQRRGGQGGGDPANTTFGGAIRMAGFNAANVSNPVAAAHNQSLRLAVLYTL